MEQYVGYLSAHSIAQTMKLKQCEADSAEQITRERSFWPRSPRKTAVRFCTGHTIAFISSSTRS
eukprot:5510238-Prorocentrum_lima.AAC.1